MHTITATALYINGSQAPVHKVRRLCKEWKYIPEGRIWPRINTHTHTHKYSTKKKTQWKRITTPTGDALMENKCAQNNLTALQLHKADRITFLNGYQATRISCTSNPAKSARKEGRGGGELEENHSLKKTFRCVYAIKKEDFWPVSVYYNNNIFLYNALHVSTLSVTIKRENTHTHTHTGSQIPWIVIPVKRCLSYNLTHSLP